MKKKIAIMVLMGAGLWGLPDSVFSRPSGAESGQTVLHSLEHRDTGVDSVLEQLHAAVLEADPEQDGFSLVYMGPTGSKAPRITLSLRRVSLMDAIRHITEAAGLYYRIANNVVIISAEPTVSGRIETRFYPVQPTFMDVIRPPREDRQPDFYFR